MVDNLQHVRAVQLAKSYEPTTEDAFLLVQVAPLPPTNNSHSPVVFFDGLGEEPIRMVFAPILHKKKEVHRN